MAITVDANGLTVENFGLADNLMMIHALDLYGAPLIVPREAPADLWQDLTSFEACLKLAASLLIMTKSQTTAAAPRKRADTLLVDRGIFESRARAQAAIEAGLVTANGKAGRQSLRAAAARRCDRGRAGASLGLARRRQAGRRARAVSDRDRGPCLPRRRRLHRRLHRSAARQWRQHGVLHRCRPQPAASVAARPSEDRLDGRDRHSRFREQAPAGAARRRGDRCQLHFAEGGAAGRALARRRADESAGADQAAIRGRPQTIQARHHQERRRASGDLRRHHRLLRETLGCTDIEVFPSSITGGDGNIEFFMGARRG